MLTSNRAVSPPSEYFDDSLLKVPSLGDTIYHNMAASFATPEIARNLMDDTFSEKPEGQALMSVYNQNELEQQTPGMSTAQRWLGDGANILGSLLNPINWGIGTGTNILMKGATGLIAAGASRVAPDAASVFMRTPLKDTLLKPLGSIVPEKVGAIAPAVMAEKTFQNFGIGAGVSVPQAVVDNYNQDSKHIQWGGVGREMGANGALGVAIGSVPFAWGLLRGMVNNALDRAPTDTVDTTHLDQALAAGRIKPVEHQWYKDFQEQQANPGNNAKMVDLQKRASQIIADNGHDVNTATNEAPFEIMKPQDVQNFTGVLADQVANADSPEDLRTALSDFMVNKRLDELTSDPRALDGVRGYVDFVNDKLKGKDVKLAEANKILDDHLLTAVKDNFPFSQKEILKHIKQAGFEQSHIDQLPVTIPENIKGNIANIRLIDELKQKNIVLQRQYERARNPKYSKKIADNEFKIKTLGKNIHDYVQRMNQTDEAKSHVKDMQQRLEKYKAENIKLTELNKTIKSGKKYSDRILINEEKINELNESMPKILTPKEELTQIRSDLLDNGLPRNFERSPQYHRLLDLSNVWKNAQTLLDRIHLEHEYNRQEAFSTIANQVLKIADSNAGTLANPENVMDYLRRRIEGTLTNPESLPETVKEQKETEKVPADADSILNEQKLQIKDTKATDAKDEFNASNEKFAEFNKSESIFKNLIQCVMGGLGGKD